MLCDFDSNFGPTVNHLNYWGSNASEYPQKQNLMMKFSLNVQYHMSLQ